MISHVITGKDEYAVVVCPSYLKGNWLYEIKKFAPHLSVKICDSKNGFRRDGSQVCILSYSQLSKAIPLFAGCRVVIADEVHYLKNPDAQRTQIFHELLEGSAPTYFIGLSGTPIKNHIKEYYSLLTLCGYNPRGTNGKKIGEDFTYWKFCNTFSNKKDLRFGGRRITKFEGVRNIPLLKEYLNKKFIRRTADKVLDLPDMILKDVMVDYSTADKELKDAWGEHSGGGRIKDHVSSAKRKAAILKADFTAKYAMGIREESERPVIIFTDHPDVCHTIRERIGKGVSIITGSTPSDERNTIVTKFQQGKVPYLVATIGAASTGFNLTATNNLIFNDVSWSVADNMQAKKRIHRIGQKNKCVIHRILGSNIDLMIMNVLDKKEEVLRRSL